MTTNEEPVTAATPQEQIMSISRQNDDGTWSLAVPLDWQDETSVTRSGWRRNLHRAVIAAIDAWRGERRDWRQGVDW